MTVPPRGAFRDEQRHVARGMVGAALVAVAVTALAVRFGGPPLPQDVRIASALAANLLTLAWLAGAIANVARLRFFSPDDIAGSGAGPPSARLRNAAAFLQNTLEQVVLAVPAQLAVAWLFGRPALTAAPAGLFCAGRLLFAVGYAGGAASRAFGFALTFYPSLGALIGCIVAVAFGGMA